MWQFTSGTSNTQCPMIGVNQTDQLTGQKIPIAKGIDTALVYSDSETNCTWKMTVNGSVASVTSGQTCMFTDTGIVFTQTYTAGTFTVTGITGVFSGSSTATGNINGSIVNCNITGNGGLSKISN
jgi:hypothetical protein